MPGQDARDSTNLHNNILRPSRSGGIIISRHVSAASSARGINVAFQGGRLERGGVKIGGGAAHIA